MNPRQRWMFDVEVENDDGQKMRINLCPNHAREVFELSENDYVGLEQSEKFVKNVRGIN